MVKLTKKQQRILREAVQETAEHFLNDRWDLAATPLSAELATQLLGFDPASTLVDGLNRALAPDKVVYKFEDCEWLLEFVPHRKTKKTKKKRGKHASR
jgi:hypothetical protein